MPGFRGVYSADRTFAKAPAPPRVRGTRRPDALPRRPQLPAPCAASSHPAGFWSLPAPSLAGGRGFRAPLRSRWEVLTEAPRVLAASSPRENVRIVTITKTHRLRQALLLIKPRLLLQLQRLASRNSWDRRGRGGCGREAPRRQVGAAPCALPGASPGASLRRGQHEAWSRRIPTDGTTRSPTHRALGLSLCIMHRVSQVSKRLGGERVAPAWQLPPSLPAAPPVSQTRCLAAPAGNGSSDRNRRPGEQPRLLAGHVQEGATGADAVFTVMTSGTPLGAPRCTRSGRHHAYSCQSADGGRPLTNSKAQSPR